MNSGTISLKLGNIPAGSSTTYSPVSASSPVKLASVPIIECATTIHKLAGDARSLHKALDETQRRILRVPAPLMPSELVLEWRKVSEAYGAILHASDVCATNLAATMNTHISLQGEIVDEDAEDMIEELSALQKDVKTAPTHMSTSCADLKRHVEAFLRSVNSTAPSRAPGAASSTAASASTSSFPHSGSVHSGRAHDETSGAPLGPVYTNDVSSRAWSRVNNALAALWQLDEHKNGSQSVPGARSAAAPETPSRAVDEALVGAIKGIIAGLDQQIQQFKAFTDVAKHLENEINAYHSAFLAFKMYPTSHARVFEVDLFIRAQYGRPEACWECTFVFEFFGLET
ncbi:uncharacterized protein TRAVEDRAFT_22579 [Trametes versicolor FP-101664 SS1]|uniref:uncharacterized protein n=1 Tax=Trametes versicolor (strain FP-101664) TaxID=717944 RepID=UPI0004622604|nr:uncharacterized protein TRAVEDRAFT_22579 [Trametes versicolor FP-101664 SS1]EIW54651.1 hypothetical protein TRAVEDRAFT_22579 [Trametes versicolor FP-101664 SS1]